MTSLSIVIPVYHESEQTLNELCQRITTTLTPLTLDGYEIIFIDDSEHNSNTQLFSLPQHYPHIRILATTNNCGRFIATIHGMEEANYETIIVMDSDLQYHPEEIPKFITAMAQGCEFASGRRYTIDRHTDFRTLCSKIMNRLSGWKFHIQQSYDYGCAFNAISKSCFSKVKALPDFQYFPKQTILATAETITEVTINHYPRNDGVSGYSYHKLFKLLITLLCK